jgi:hypothetical protein
MIDYNEIKNDNICILYDTDKKYDINFIIPVRNRMLFAKPMYNSKLNVQRNLIHCQNEKFIIRIDRMNNESLRYSTWNKPNNENSEPGLILSNGEIERQGTMGGYIYTFRNGEWRYIVEDNQMGESDEMIGIFLKLLKNEKQILYTKMKEIR